MKTPLYTPKSIEPIASSKKAKLYCVTLEDGTKEDSIIIALGRAKIRYYEFKGKTTILEVTRQ